MKRRRSPAGGWHARLLIDAVRAVKDMYCEKSMAPTPAQGVAIVKAVKETNRIVQTGTQQRSLPVIREAKEKFIDSGLTGAVTMVLWYWNQNYGYIVPDVHWLGQRNSRMRSSLFCDTARRPPDSAMAAGSPP
jgi:predicted dehydrogenase